MAPTTEFMEDQRYRVALNMVLGVGKTLFHRLVQALGSARNVFQATRSELKGVEGIGDKIAAEILNFDVETCADREFRLAEKLGVRILTSSGPEYPALLNTIYDPPPVLYCQGEELNRFPVPLAVVGTRLPSSYGKLATERLCGSLASMGFCIVSGLARGIDTLAHKSALQSGGNTIAVLGCGLSRTYPPENFKLRERIVRQGAVVSEFPLTMGPEKNNFPARNRVISGLSYGTLIIEAGEKSGALITAQFALEQGREVFALPGTIYSPKSRGTNRLIHTGARLVDGPEAIVEELSSTVGNMIEIPESKPQVPSDLSPNEKKLISLLASEEIHIDSLIENSQLSPGEVSATLVELELKGLVRQLEGKRYVIR